MLISFFKIDGYIHKESLFSGQTDNAKSYYDVLRRLTEGMKRNWPKQWCTDKWVLHHGSAPAHASLAVKEILASVNMMIALHFRYLILLG